ncbi:MAG TPA: PAS domain-containing sensor histidine kinase, partial [Gammaproteobacteria bacterium]
MTKFRIKLTLVFILFMTIAVIGLGLFSAHNMKQNHIETLKESLQREIMLISATVPWHTELPLEQRIVYFEQQAAYLRPFTESRITFIDRDGVVLGDSDHDARQMDNHLDREEIQAALTGDGTGFSIRYSDTVDRNILNLAMAVEENGERVGF